MTKNNGLHRDALTMQREQQRMGSWKTLAVTLLTLIAATY